MTKEDLFGDELERRSPSASGPPPDDARGIPGGTVEDGPTPDHGDDDMNRRAALQVIAALGAGTAIPPGAFESVLSGIDGSVSESATPLRPHWEEAAWEYSQTIWVKPTGALAQDLTWDLASIGATLGKNLPEAHRKNLLRVGAQLSAYLAQELSDLGNLRAARRAFQSAIGAAEASGDQELIIWVHAYNAARAACEGRPAALVDSLLGEAIGRAGPAPSVGLATALQTQAESRAAQGDSAGAEESLARLRGVFEKLSSPTTGDHITPWGWPEEYLRFTESLSYAMLGKTRQANTAIDRALELSPLEREGTRTNLQLMRPIVLVREGEIAEGLERAVAAVQGVPGSTARRRVAGEIIRALPDPQARALPAARELRALTVTA
ncbi:hypothetical protein [Actinomadura roseirufa]|uniref:hypothetical protein n=1 Tax=Actinomadura roseirufa TaxID=2094049 RepID=UPI0010410AD9|nr:hypothetical protein [Actinomadura roseirufa]